jgi:hypothetical protein
MNLDSHIFWSEDRENRILNRVAMRAGRRTRVRRMLAVGIPVLLIAPMLLLRAGVASSGQQGASQGALAVETSPYSSRPLVSDAASGANDGGALVD